MDLMQKLSTNEKEVFDKIKSKIMICQKRGKITYTDFLDPAQIEIGQQIVNKYYRELHYFFSGGFDHSERKIMVIYPEFLSQEEIEIPVKAIHIAATSKTASLQHKNVLGAVLGLGLKREKVGDIFVESNHADVILYKEAAEYLLIFLKKVGRYSVECEEITLSQIKSPEVHYKIIHATVASLRADAIISSGLGESRSRSSNWIKSGRLKINHKEVKNVAYMVSEGDLISVKGKGRIILDKILGTTKKDRIKVIIKKVI